MPKYTTLEIFGAFAKKNKKKIGARFSLLFFFSLIYIFLHLVSVHHYFLLHYRFSFTETFIRISLTQSTRTILYRKRVRLSLLFCFVLFCYAYGFVKLDLVKSENLGFSLGTRV